MGRRFQLEELHRFPNGGVCIGDRTYWDVLSIWGQMHQGFGRFSAIHRRCPVSLGVDAWGIDFALLDEGGRLISNPVHYRDRRTEGVPERLFDMVDEKTLFSETGVQSWRINTLFQLYSMVLAGDSELQFASTLLTIPDLFSYFLCGAATVEYTEATTTQMFSPHASNWARQVLRKVGIPEEILPEVAKHYNLSNDPNDRAISGSSSGGNASFNAAWTRFASSSTSADRPCTSSCSR